MECSHQLATGEAFRSLMYALAEDKCDFRPLSQSVALESASEASAKAVLGMFVQRRFNIHVFVGKLKICIMSESHCVKDLFL